MLNKYRIFLNSNSVEIFGDIPLKIRGSYRISKCNNNNIYIKISINLGYQLIVLEEVLSPGEVEEKLSSFINKYFVNIEKYEIDELYELAKNLFNDKKVELDIYDYEEENIITEFENTIDYDILKEKYPTEIKQICDIYTHIYKYVLNNF